MFSICHPWFTTTNLSYTFPIFETSATASCGSTVIHGYMSSCVKLTYCYCFRSYRLSHSISAQPKSLLTLHLARNGSIMQYLYIFAPVVPLYFTMRGVCSMYEALFLLVKSIALPPPLHRLASLVDPSGQPVAKLKIHKLQTTSNRAMQLVEKIKKQTSGWTLSHFRYSLCVIILPLTLPSQPLFHHHLLPSFVEPTTFSLENALFALFAVNSNWMQDLSTHPSKNHPPKHPPHHHHLPTTYQQPASSLACCASFASLTSKQFISVEKWTSICFLSSQECQKNHHYCVHFVCAKNPRSQYVSIDETLAPHPQQLPVLFANLPSRPHHEFES